MSPPRTNLARARVAATVYAPAMRSRRVISRFVLAGACLASACGLRAPTHGTHVTLAHPTPEGDGRRAPSSGAAHLDLPRLLARNAPDAARAELFRAFAQDAFTRLATVVRRGESKGADAITRSVCTLAVLEGFEQPRAPSDSAEWSSVRRAHRSDGDEGGSLALLGLSGATEGAERERAAILAWSGAGAERSLPQLGRLARVALAREGLCPTASGLVSLESTLRAQLAAALELRDRHAVLTPENTHSEHARDALRAFTVAPIGILASTLARGDFHGARQLVADPAVGGFLHPAIVEAVGHVGASPSAAELAALALTLRIVVERDTRQRGEGAESLVELASARLVREAQVLQPTGPETTLLAARVFAGIGLGAVGIPMLEAVAAQTREHDWLREALLVCLGAEGEAASRGDRRDAERILSASAPVFEAVAKQHVTTTGRELWRAQAIAGEAALREGDGAAAEAHFRSVEPTPPELQVPLARLEGAAGHGAAALARLENASPAIGPGADAERAVVACEIAAFGRLPEAQSRCESALDGLLGVRALWSGDQDTKHERLLARLLVRFRGGAAPALRALDRAYLRSPKTTSDASFVVAQAIGVALVSDAPDALGPWGDRARELDADDFAYFGLWLKAILTRHGRPDESLDAALRRIHPRSTWVRSLVAATLGGTPEGLPPLAQIDAERAESAFYMGLHAWAHRADRDARKWFEACRAFRALELMEHGFAEGLLLQPSTLTLPSGRALP